MYIPSKTHDPVNSEINARRLHLNSCDTWCIRRKLRAGKWLEKAAERAVKRFEMTGRFVDPYFILHDVGNKSQSNFYLFKKLREFANIETYLN